MESPKNEQYLKKHDRFFFKTVKEDDKKPKADAHTREIERL